MLGFIEIKFEYSWQAITSLLFEKEENISNLSRSEKSRT